jgi:hypothetical protein
VKNAERKSIKRREKRREKSRKNSQRHAGKMHRTEGVSSFILALL